MDTVTVERLRKALAMLERAGDEREPVKTRLGELRTAMDRLLSEIESFGRVYYCGGAAACLLGHGVTKVLAGSVVQGSHRHAMPEDAAETNEGYRLQRDICFNKPSPAAEFVLGRVSANGWVEWKDRRYRPMSAKESGR